METFSGAKRLFLLRHAKSSWDDPGLPDHDRPLAARGRKAGKRIAGYMKGRGFDPRIVLCSSAVRARETLDLIGPVLPEDAGFQIESGLYHADGRELLGRLRRIPNEVPSVLLIGHNPGIQDLALMLASAGAKLPRIRRKLPTAALAVLDAPIDDWEHLGTGSALLADYATPKDVPTLGS